MNLPEDFVNNIKPLLNSEWSTFLEALDDVPPVCIRLNKNKSGLFNMLSTNRVPWCDTGYYLDKRPQFTFDPLFHAGCYYVQEASSMFVAQAIKQYMDKDVKVLDLCAAPGGKSTLIADLISDNSLLVSNEVIRSRANILSENISKWGNPNVVVTNNDPADFTKLKHFFDIILVDAPCSGEGMFRKDNASVGEWSPANVILCKERQQRIVADVWESLKPGGILLYSTCTYNTHEDEDNVQWIADKLEADVLSVNIKEEWGISMAKKGQLPVYRFFPHKTKGEGFFLAVLRKKEGNIVETRRRKDKNKTKIVIPEYLKDYITSPDEFEFIQNGDLWNAVPKIVSDDLRYVFSQLSVVSYGILLGEIKRKYFIPDQSLAMSAKLNKQVFNCCDVSWGTAISFLRRESLMLEDQPKGYVLLTYKEVPIGFVKNIGNRANNLYPQEWRIRSANIPDMFEVIG